MALGRPKSNEIKQENQQKNPLSPVPQITIQPASQAAALNIPLPGRDPEMDKIEATALGVALTYRSRAGEAATFASVCKNINSLFQPSLLAAKVYYAAPLDEIENDIRKAFAKDPTILSKTFHIGVACGTLLQLAVIGLNQTIRNDQDVVVDPGMAERILELHYELSPDTYEQALEKTKIAAPLEEEKEKEARESANSEAVNKAFNSIRRNDANTKQDLADFKAWIKSQKPKELTDNRYHLNLIHLICCGFDVLAKRGGTLQGGWYSALGDQFCFKVIGDAIQSELPPRIQQILRSSLYHLVNSDRAAPRVVDLHSAIFKSHKPSWSSTELQLGVDSYFDDIGRSAATGGQVGVKFFRCGGEEMLGGYSVRAAFQNLSLQLNQPVRITPRARKHSRSWCIIL